MASQLNPRLLSFYRDVSRVASGIVIAVGFLVLISALFDSSAPNILARLAAMQANTALAFVLSGISLWLGSTQTENRQVDRIAKGCAALIVLIGVLTLSEYIFNQDFGIDQLFFTDAQSPESAYPGRMSPFAALNFSLLGVALFLLDRHQYRWPVQVLSITALLISVLALLGYAYGVSALYQFFPYSSISIYTMLAFSILCVGILFARPEQGLMEIFSSDTLGGVLARRLVPAALVLPFFLGWLLLIGQRMGMYDSTFRLVLYTLFIVIAYTILIWRNAGLLQHTDQARQLTQAQLSEVREREAAILYASLDAVITIDSQGRILEFNPAAQKIFGYDRADALGREMSQLIIPPALREQHQAGLAKYLATGDGPVLGKRIEMTGMRANGTEFPVELTITAITGGEQTIFTGFVREITQRRQAEEKIAYQAYLLENVNDAVIGSDENSMIRFWNQAAEKMFGWKAEEVVGRSGREILRSEFIDTDRQTVLKILAEQGRWRGEAILYHKNGTRVIMEVSSITLRDANGMITGYVSVNRDIAERKLVEQELRKNTVRTQALADMSRQLATVHLEYQSVLDATAQRTTELIGDACSIRLVSDDGQWLELASLYHPVPKTLALLREILGTHPLRTDRGSVAQIIQTGQPVLIPVLSPEQLKAIVPATSWSILEQISIHSLLTVPLRAQGGVLGTLTLVREQPNRPFTAEDQTFLQDLADRAALSIANSHLYTAMQQLNNELEQRVMERTAALSQANTLLQTMLDHMPDHIYFKDSESRFIRNSRSQARALGLSDPAEAVGKSDFDFFPHAQLSYEKEQEIIRSGNPLVDEEERVVWPDGQQTWVSTTKVPLLDDTGQIIGTFGISRDITERKRGEVALQKAKLELEAANKELESFSYSVSHDLRAPLRSVDGYSQALMEDYGELLPVEGRNFLKRIHSSAQRMADLIDDLLELSRVTRAQLTVVPVDLTRLAENILTDLQQTHPERNVRCSIAPNLTARGDPHLLQIVLENLLNNAWKYSSRQEQAEIEFGSKHENEETIYFVRDNGAGFDMAYANKLFGAFQRLHSGSEFPGTGIGLATVQRIIHRHGGSIWAEAAVGQGAMFFFKLPAWNAAPPKTEQKQEDSIIHRAKEII